MSTPPQPITWGDPSSLDRAVLDSPGGFAWWYADQLDDHGTGFVLIWSFGLPFLPGYLQAARDGRPERPRQRPALNLVLFKDGEPWFYALQEHAEASWTGSRFVFGSSSIEWINSETVAVDAQLDLQIPGGGRCQGRIQLRGPRVKAPQRLDQHLWAPVTGPAWARAELLVGTSKFESEGHAYHDRNSSLVSFDALGIERWSWGRRVEPEKTSIYYVTWPNAGPPLAWWATVLADGSATFLEAEVTMSALRRARFGMRHADLRLVSPAGEWKIKTQSLVDDGPFYLRSRVQFEGAVAGQGVGEWVEPARVDLGRHRPLVRMRVHRLEGRNSIWLPLFCGTRDDRWRRLLRVQ